MTGESFIPLRSVELDVLLSVAETPKHGYAILKDAKERMGRHPGFEIPTLYRALRRMRDLGLIRSLESRDAEETDARRQFWQATSLGREALAAEIDRLERVVAEGSASVRRIAGESA
jgi:DNA-binding PadR family transcriptional regulator